MAHLIDTMAYANATPWHGLGNHLSARQPIEVWAKQADMDWDICEVPVRFMTKGTGEGHLGSILSYADNKGTFPLRHQRTTVCRESALSGGTTPRHFRVLS